MGVKVFQMKIPMLLPTDEALALAQNHVELAQAARKVFPIAYAALAEVPGGEQVLAEDQIMALKVALDQHDKLMKMVWSKVAKK